MQRGGRSSCRPSASTSSEADIDLYTALIAGLVNQQWANDPGGSRWGRLLDRAIDMYADNLGLPREEP